MNARAEVWRGMAIASFFKLYALDAQLELKAGAVIGQSRPKREQKGR